MLRQKITFYDQNKGHLYVLLLLSKETNWWPMYKITRVNPPYCFDKYIIMGSQSLCLQLLISHVISNTS